MTNEINEYTRTLKDTKWGRCGYCETSLLDPMDPKCHAHMNYCGPYCEAASKGKGIPSMNQRSDHENCL